MASLQFLCLQARYLAHVPALEACKLSAALGRPKQALSKEALPPRRPDCDDRSKLGANTLARDLCVVHRRH